MRFAVFIYDGVEPVDLATYGVLSMARRVAPQISMFTVAPSAGEVKMANGLRVIADHGFDDCPRSDALIVTGGPGWVAQCESTETLDFVRRYAEGRVVAGVCTGAMILAASGILDGRKATTKCEVAGTEVPPVRLMRDRHPQIDVTEEASLVDCGAVITGGGVTLGIDATLHLLSRLVGEQVANETARIMEYSRAWQVNREALPVIVQ
ncbi:MAG: DJ-1/PfpI family protein [Pseudomonadota bacterium]|nr:DJ-1/PfpI family protein [Pseudomonadota bacterium]